MTLTEARTLLKQAERVAVTEDARNLMLRAWRRSGATLEMPSGAMLVVAAEIVALAEVAQ